MKEQVPLAVLELLSRLHRAGFEAYPVGGCVRDLLRGRVPHDWDVATSALPKQTEQALATCRTVETGIRHGTVTVLTGGYAVEVTSFRAEGGYSDGRHPDAVRFGVSLLEDLARRDFTIGAMALNCETDAIIDPYGGQADLAAGLLRAVGVPQERFSEDALRILRGLRFAAVMGFSIEDAAAAAMRKNADMLRQISPERIRVELEKLLCGEHAAAVLREYAGILEAVLPEIGPMRGFLQHNPHHNRDVWEHTLAVVQAIPAEPVLRWSALFHDIAKPQCFTMDEAGIGHFHGHPPVSAEMARTILRRLRCESSLIEAVTSLITIHDIRFPAEKKLCVRWAGRWGEKRFRQFLELRRADTLGQADPAEANVYHDAMLRLLAEAKAAHACFSVKDLAVKGHDITALGYQGPEVGAALRQLVEAVQEGLLPNEREALLDYLASSRAIK